MKILFVCSGNICRSPMAAEYMRTLARSGGGEGLVVDSAGTLGIERAPASEGAVKAMGEIGVDLAGHRSKGLRPEHLEQADLIIVMTHAHLSELASMFPRERTRRFVLRAFEHGAEPDSDAPDLDDPMGRPLRVYREQVPIIARCVDHLAQHVLQRS